MAYRLGIDLGTTNTVASVAADGAPVQLVGLGARSQQMRSMLFVAEDGQFAVGDEAADRAAGDLSRLIIDPRKQLGTDVPTVVGGQEIRTEQATAAMISFAVARATAQQHQPPSETVLSHPAHWDEYKVECFDRAIAAANLGTVRRCTDAEAAVAMYAARESLGNGERVVVYDLGGGSCEVTVLEKTSSGARVLGASEGVDDPASAISTKRSFGWCSATSAAAVARWMQTTPIPGVGWPESSARVRRQRRHCRQLQRQRSRYRCPATAQRYGWAARNSCRWSGRGCGRASP